MGFSYIEMLTNLSLSQKQSIVQLWNKEYPKALQLSNVAAFDAYLLSLNNPCHTLVIQEGNIVGWLTVFERDGAHWFAMILDSSIQGKGVGSQLLFTAKKNHSELNGWVIQSNEMPKQDGRLYVSPTRFYQKNGFKLIPSKKLSLPHFKAIKIHWSS